jgi:glutathione peroxidase-family protein
MRPCRFPCNQFGAQEPGSNAEVKDFAIKKGLSKVLFAKIDVNGPAAHPLYVKLKKEASNKTFMSSMLGDDIKWNFAKFLISNGKIIRRYEPTSSPKGMLPDIERAINRARELEAGFP